MHFSPVSPENVRHRKNIEAASDRQQKYFWGNDFTFTALQPQGRCTVSLCITSAKLFDIRPKRLILDHLRSSADLRSRLQGIELEHKVSQHLTRSRVQKTPSCTLGSRQLQQLNKKRTEFHIISPMLLSCKNQNLMEGTEQKFINLFSKASRHCKRALPQTLFVSCVSVHSCGG